MGEVVITFSGANWDEVKKDLCSCACSIQGKSAEALQYDAEEVVSDDETVVDEPKTKSTRGRKKATPATEPAPAPAVNSVPESPPPAPASKLTLDDLKMALKKHAAKYNLDKSRELLSKFGGATRLQDLKQEYYDAFYKAALETEDANSIF